MNRLSEFRLEVPGKPHPAARPRFARVGKGVHTFPGKGDKEAKARIHAAWLAAGRPRVEGEWTAQIRVIVPRPKSHWCQKGVSAAGRRAGSPPADVDNYGKTVLDGLVEAGAVSDDRHCLALSVSKHWSTSRDDPGVTAVWITARS